MSKTRRSVVLDLSVYNAVSHARRDLTIAEITNALRAKWVPAWAPVAEVVTLESVREAADRLVARGLVAREVETVAIPIRDPRSAQGRYVWPAKDRSDLMWQGK